MIDLKDAIHELNHDIEFVGAKMLTEGECVILLRELERLQALTASIPLDRLEVIANAERDGRCVVLEKPANHAVVMFQDGTFDVLYLKKPNPMYGVGDITGVSVEAALHDTGRDGAGRG